MGKLMYPSGVTVSIVNSTISVRLFFSWARVHPNAIDLWVIRYWLIHLSRQAPFWLGHGQLGGNYQWIIMSQMDPHQAESEKEMGQVGFCTWVVLSSCLSFLANCFLLFPDWPPLEHPKMVLMIASRVRYERWCPQTPPLFFHLCRARSRLSNEFLN